MPASRRRSQIVQLTLRRNHIRARLTALDMTQEQGADLCGLSYRHFNRIILNDVPPSLLTALRIEHVLDAPIAALWDVQVKTRRPRRRRSA